MLFYAELDESNIITAPYTLTPNLYVRHALSHTVGTLIIVATAVALATLVIVILTGDLRWAFVSLILLFCCFPIILAGLYFSTLLKPQARIMLAERTVIISPSLDITIKFTDSTIKPVTRSHTLIKSLSIDSKLVKIRLTDPYMNILLIPTQNIPDTGLSQLRELQFAC